MCDYSLQTVRSRPATVGEKLRTQRFNLGNVIRWLAGQVRKRSLIGSGRKAEKQQPENCRCAFHDQLQYTNCTDDVLAS